MTWKCSCEYKNQGWLDSCDWCKKPNPIKQEVNEWKTLLKTENSEADELLYMFDKMRRFLTRK